VVSRFLATDCYEIPSVETCVLNIHSYRDGWNFLPFLGDLLLHLICQNFGVLTVITMHQLDINDIEPLTTVLLLYFLSPCALSRRN